MNLTTTENYGIFYEVFTTNTDFMRFRDGLQAVEFAETHPDYCIVFQFNGSTGVVQRVWDTEHGDCRPKKGNV